MKPLPTSALTHVVEHLPSPVVVLDGGGFVVTASPCAVTLLALSIDSETHLDRHLEASDGTHAAGRRSLISTDGGVHELVSIAGVPDPPPKDVAALAGAVAHDFNNLLGVIMNFTTLAAATLPPGSAAANDLREVLAASQRAATIAQRLQELGEVRLPGRFTEPR